MFDYFSSMFSESTKILLSVKIHVCISDVDWLPSRETKTSLGNIICKWQLQRLCFLALYALPTTSLSSQQQWASSNVPQKQPWKRAYQLISTLTSLSHAPMFHLFNHSYTTTLSSRRSKTLQARQNLIFLIQSQHKAQEYQGSMPSQLIRSDHSPPQLWHHNFRTPSPKGPLGSIFAGPHSAGRGRWSSTDRWAFNFP